MSSPFSNLFAWQVVVWQIFGANSEIVLATVVLFTADCLQVHILSTKFVIPN